MLTLLLVLLGPAGAADLPTAPLSLGWTLSGSWPGSDYGLALASAGDVDLNLFPDLVVGAPADDQGRGRVALYRAAQQGGGYTGESWTTSGTEENSGFGGVLAGGQDLDGDGFTDVAVGCSVGTWQVSVYAGGEGGLSVDPAWSEDSGGGTFGRSLAMPGDVDGDGYAELVAGNTSLGDNGQVLVYMGGHDGLGHSAVVLSGDEDHPVGAVVAAAGDVDGDGLADILSGGGPALETPLAAAVFAGSAAGPSPTPSYHLAWPSGAQGFGASMAGVGDVDGDGWQDLCIGADGIPATGGVAGAGQVLCWRGGATGPDGTPTWTWADPVAGTMAGRAIAGAGDVDGDGFADVLIGRPAWSDDQHLEGGALLLMGSAAGLGTSTAWTMGGDADSSDHGDAWIGTGQAVAGLLDVDLDGYTDVAVGVPNVGADTDEGRLGQVRVYRGQAWAPPTGGGDTAADTGADTGDSPAPSGCGCAGVGGALPGMGWLIGLLALARRRR